MPPAIDRAAIEAAFRTWEDRTSPPPPGLQPLVERLRDEADRELRAARFGAERAEAIAWQIYLYAAVQRLRGKSFFRRGPCIFGGWEASAALARAAEGEARAELLDLAIRVGGGAGNLEPDCLAELAPLLEPATARTWALDALADPDLDADAQGVLLGVLPEEDVAALLPLRIEKAAAIEDYEERWSTLRDLVRHVPEAWTRRAEEENRARHGEMDEVHFEQARAAAERAHWGAPITAWRLGEEASGLPADERGPLLDRAIEEFWAIALTPVSPGNDEGPFWAMARMLDEPRVRRALAVVDRMEGADWRGDLDASRAALLGQLAILGHAGEAEGIIGRIGTGGELDAHWRAVAWGRVFGARLALEPGARFEVLFARTAEDPAHHDPDWRFRVLDTIAGVFEDRPAPDTGNVEALIDLARSFEPRRREIAFEELMRAFLGAVPVQRWVDLTLADLEGQLRVEALICLAEALCDAGLDPVPALRPLLADLHERPCAEPVWTFRDLCGLRSWIAAEEALPCWTDFLRRAGDGDAWPAVDDVRADLPEILVWLSGPQALLSAGRAIAQAAALLP